MEHAHTLPELLQHRHCILAGLCNPVAVHFEADQVWVGSLDKDIEARGTGETEELVIMIVEAKAHSQTARSFSPLIELIGSPTIVINCVAKVLWQYRADHEAHAKLAGVVKLGGKALVIEMPARHPEPRVEDHPAQLLRRMRIDIPVSLDLVVADSPNLLQQRSKVGFGLPTHRVKLYTK